MPTLREYTSSSENSGYYLQANVGGAHPITLQVTPIAQTIFQQVGYDPTESVPTKLVWAMYDLGLLYTDKSLASDNVKNVSTEETLRSLGLENRLTPEEKNQVLSYIEKYNGPKKRNLTQLKRELESEVGSEPNVNSASTQGGHNQVPETTEEAVSCLFSITSGVSEFRTAKRNVDQTYLLSSLETFIPHPHVDMEFSGLDSGWNMRYMIEGDRSGKKIIITDQRGQQVSGEYSEADYVLQIHDPIDGRAEAAITDEKVTEFENETHGAYFVHDLYDDLGWILPPNPSKLPDKYRDDMSTYKIGKVQVVKVDRISGRGNSVIEVNNRTLLLDRGVPGERFLAIPTRGDRWKAVAKLD
jgi:hypothetical protein